MMTRILRSRDCKLYIYSFCMLGQRDYMNGTCELMNAMRDKFLRASVQVVNSEIKTSSL